MALTDIIAPRGGTIAAQGPFAVTASGGITISNTNTRPGSGDACLLVDVSAATGQLLKQFPSNSAKAALSIAFRFEPVHSSDQSQDFALVRDAAGTKLVKLTLHRPSGGTTSELKITSTDGTLTDTQTFPFLIADGRWYVVQLSVDVSANPWLSQWRARLDGDTWTDGPPSSIASTAISLQYHRIGYGTIVSGFATRLQDYAIQTGTVAYPTDCYFTERPPTSVGTHSLDASPSTKFFTDDNITETAIANTDTTSYQFIDDTPNFETGVDRIEIHASDTTHYVAYKINATGASDIGYVQIIGYFKQDIANATDNPILKVVENIDTINVLTGSINSTTGMYKRVCIDPPSGGSWSNARLAACQFQWGFASSIAAGSNPHLETLSAIVGIPSPVGILGVGEWVGTVPIY